MILDEIEKISIIESFNIETKARLDREDTVGWLKTVAGFANAGGGTMYVGVEDKTNKLIGFDRKEADSERNYFNNEVNQHIIPVPAIRISFLPYCNNGKELYVIKIEVPESPMKPVSLKYKGVMGIYMRREGYTNGATVEEVIAMASESKQARYDMLVSDTDYNSGDFRKLFRLYSENNEGKELTDKILQSINFFNEEGKLRNGALLFRDDYDGGRTLVKCSLFSGLTRGSDRILSSSSFDGNILDSISFMMDYVGLRMNHSIIKKDFGRDEADSYPRRALLEGIVNAVAHRDYFIEGAQIQIDMFKDRLEISSPGSFYGRGKVEKTYDLTKFVSKRRNEVVSAVLVKCRMMEAEGTGFEKITEAYRNADMPHKPFIYSASDYFKLILPDLTYDRGVENLSALPTPDFIPLELTGRYDSAILTFCSFGAKEAGEIAASIGVKPSSYFRKNILNPLLKKGYLEEFGEKKPFLYRTNPDIIEKEDTRK